MDNLFSAEWTEGSLESIDGVVKVLSFISVIVISIVGYGIIISSLLKNSVAALYVANPRLWDKVDKIKTGQAHVIDPNTPLGKVQGVSQLGTVLDILLGLFPNIKKLTDFDDGVLDAKVYFLKAIPMMCLTIFIGAFVFKGYPARWAAKITNFGTATMDLVLHNVDPIAWLNYIPTEFVLYSYTTDNAEDDVSQHINDVAKKLTSTYVGAVNDISKDTRLVVARELEAWASSNTADYQSYCDKGLYKCDIKTMIQYVDPTQDVERIHGKEANGITTFAYALPISNFDKGASSIDVSNMYVEYVVKFTRIATKTKAQNYNCSLALPSNKLSLANGTVITSEVGTADSSYYLYALSGASGMMGDIEVSISVTSTNTFKVTSKYGTKSLEGYSNITGISGLYYYVGTEKHKIKSIYYNGTSSSGVFTALDKTGSDNQSIVWSWGESPNAKSSESSGSESSGTIVESGVDWDKE